MKLSIKLESKHLFIFSFLLVVVVNLLILYRVYDNRTSTPDSVVTLTQRELSLPYSKFYEDGGYEHNKIRFFHINWRIYSTNGYYFNSPTCLDSDKLKELGFDIDRYMKNDQISIPRDAYVVLEVNSSLYKKEIGIIGNHYQSSRLYVIDAGIDRYELRDKFPQRDKYIILKGVINTQYTYTEKKKDGIKGYIESLSVTNIHIEQKYHKILLDLFENKKSEQIVEYKVKVAFGSRLEPYIISLTTSQ